MAWRVRASWSAVRPAGAYAPISGDPAMAFATTCSKRFSFSAITDPVSLSASAISSRVLASIIFDIATEPFVESGDEPSVDGLLLLGERCERPVQSARVMVLDGCPEQILLVGAGFRDTSLTLLAKVPFDRHWSVQAFVQIRYLLGDAANSPLTQSRVQPTFAGFFAYSF